MDRSTLQMQGIQVHVELPVQHSNVQNRSRSIRQIAVENYFTDLQRMKRGQYLAFSNNDSYSCCQITKQSRYITDQG